jgi:hypothetical protein
MGQESFGDVRVDVAIADHPKVHLAGAAGLAVYVAALAHCRRFYGDERRMPRAAARALLGGEGGRQWRRLVDPRVGWFVEVGDDEVEISRELEIPEAPPEAERAARRREKGAARQQRFRDARRNASGVTNTVTGDAGDAVTNVTVTASPLPPGSPPLGDSPLSPLSESGSGSDAPARREDAPRDPLGDHELGAAWAAGIREGHGSSPAVPRDGALRALCDAVRAQLPGDGLEARARRLRAWAVDYGRQRRGAVVNPHACADWINSGCPPPTKARGLRQVQPAAAPGESSWESSEVERWGTGE